MIKIKQPSEMQIKVQVVSLKHINYLLGANSVSRKIE